MTPPSAVEKLPDVCAVAIVGSGPAGLSLATELAQQGITDIVVLERESAAGGVPRHCGHPPFGLREFKRCYTGPVYARCLVQRAIEAQVKIYTGVTVIETGRSGALLLSSNQGLHRLKAQRVVLCTGVRETPRSARLITGNRPSGVMTTGALQSMVYLNNKRPFIRPVIVGTELVSFSVLLTCRSAGIKPVAMIEEAPRVTAWKPARYFPQLLGTRLMVGSRLESIEGRQSVNGVTVRKSDGNYQHIVCDGVVFSGQFTPESALLINSHLRVDHATGGPWVDQFGRCSDPAYFAAGNLLRPVESAGWCWQEGKNIAARVAESFKSESEGTSDTVTLNIGSKASIKYVVPQHITRTRVPACMPALQVRFLKAGLGTLAVYDQTRLLWSRKCSVLPERRFLIPLDPIMAKLQGSSLTIRFDTSMT